MTLAAVVFWTSAAALAYTWIGYPLLLRVAARRRTSTVARRGGAPDVSVIIAAFNEAGTIRAKLDSTLAGQRYPAERLEAIVVSDGSTDATDTLVAGYPDRRARLIRQEPRSGKSLALNRGVAAARGEVLVFTDANALFAPDAIARLVAPFVDPDVGLVSGQGLYAAEGGDARVAASGYVRYEAAIKAGEAALGFLASADGAIYAIRRALYRELAASQVNDLLHPIQAALAGYRCDFDAGAFTVEPPSRSGAQEFRRHARIIAQGMHLVRCWLPPLVRARRWRAVWLLASHRVLRWASAFFLLGALAAGVALRDEAPVYRIALLGQLGFYALAAGGLAAERLGRRLGPLALPYFFCTVSAAGVAGLARFVRGGAQAVWSPAGQAVPGRAA